MIKMKKFKKFFTVFFLSIFGTLHKVFATTPLYAPDTLSIPYESTWEEKITKIGNIIAPILLFIIGILVILNKKLSKRAKVQIISSLVVLVIVGLFLLNNI